MSGVSYKIMALLISFLFTLLNFASGQFPQSRTRSATYEKRSIGFLTVARRISGISLSECCLYCLNDNYDGFVFCETATCYHFNLTNIPDSGNLQNVSECSVFIQNQQQAATVTTSNSSITSSAPISGNTTLTTTSTVSDSTTSASCSNLAGGGCTCLNGATDAECTQYVTDCTDYNYKSGVTEGLVYIKPLTWSGSHFPVRCYKGQTLIQMRDESASCRSLSFNGSWTEYKDGIGDPFLSCYWLGNDKITVMTKSRSYALMFDTDISFTKKWIITYHDFQMATSDNYYTMSYSYIEESSEFTVCNGFEGPVDRKARNQRFYTYDDDNVNNCAAQRGAGWWYDSNCDYGNLNKLSPLWPIKGSVTTLNTSLLYLQRS